jgi:2-oxoglutarate ferredoxin oxidoreductase subunit gamma
MLNKTIISGFGGQGVLFMGYCLATAAMDEGFFTTYLPSYGAEVRGGTANCTVAVSDEPIASPVASEPRFVVAMNNPSLVRFQSHLVEGGSLFVNSDLVETETHRTDVTLVKIPAVTIATEIGNPRGVNIVMIGAFLKHTGLLSYDCMERAVSKLFSEKSEKLVELNVNALHSGFHWKES